MKYEIKINFTKKDELEKVIQESYFEDGTLGKLVGKKTFLKIDPNDPTFTVFTGLNNLTVKLTNDEMIDGSMRCVVDEATDGVSLYPINNFCIVQEGKYSFY